MRLRVRVLSARRQPHGSCASGTAPRLHDTAWLSPPAPSASIADSRRLAFANGAVAARLHASLLRPAGAWSWSRTRINGFHQSSCLTAHHAGDLRAISGLIGCGLWSSEAILLACSGKPKGRRRSQRAPCPAPGRVFHSCSTIHGRARHDPDQSKCDRRTSSSPLDACVIESFLGKPYCEAGLTHRRDYLTPRVAAQRRSKLFCRGCALRRCRGCRSERGAISKRDLFRGGPPQQSRQARVEDAARWTGAGTGIQARGPEQDGGSAPPHRAAYSWSARWLRKG